MNYKFSKILSHVQIDILDNRKDSLYIKTKTQKKYNETTISIH